MADEPADKEPAAGASPDEASAAGVKVPGNMVNSEHIAVVIESGEIEYVMMQAAATYVVRAYLEPRACFEVL